MAGGIEADAATDDGVRHRAVLLELAHDIGYRRLLLADRDVPRI